MAIQQKWYHSSLLSIWGIDAMDMDASLRILMITSEWPTEKRPDFVPFIVRQADFLRSAGLMVDVFAFRGSKKPFNYLRAWFQVRKKLRRDSYDLVHAQWG